MKQSSYEKSKSALFRPWHGIAFLLGFGGVLLQLIVMSKPHIVEYHYSRSIYPPVSNILSDIGQLIPPPRSFIEIFVMTVFFLGAVLFIRFIYRSFKQRRSIFGAAARMSIHMLAIVSAGYSLYLILWGLNYYRQPLNVTLKIDPLTVQAKIDYFDLGNDMLALANAYGIERRKHEHVPLENVDQSVDKALGRFLADAFPELNPHLPPSKTFIFNEWMNVCGISGIFLFPFMEPHLNAELLDWEKPCIAVHEKAHFLGFASETDADLMAYITCLNSDSSLLKYSAALHILNSLRSRMPKETWNEKFRNKLTDHVIADMKDRDIRLLKHRKKYQKAQAISRNVNDRYLKLNAQKLGVASYGAALNYLTGWWKTHRDDLMPGYSIETGSR